jgi:hypothetical protein
MEPMNVSATMHATGVQQVQRELIHYLVIFGLSLCLLRSLDIL